MSKVLAQFMIMNITLSWKLRIHGALLANHSASDVDNFAAFISAT